MEGWHHSKVNSYADLGASRTTGHVAGDEWSKTTRAGPKCGGNPAVGAGGKNHARWGRCNARNNGALFSADLKTLRP